MDIYHQDGVDFRKDEVEWFAQRINTSASGACIVPYYLVTKYKHITGVERDNAIIRNKILTLCAEYL